MSDEADGRSIDGPDSAALSIRALTGDEAEVYARLLIDVWRETYEGLMPAERLSALELGPVAAGVRRMLDDPSVPPTHAAFRADALVGWARAGEPRDDDAPDDVELWSLNVARAARGSGVAQRLMETAIDGRAAYLWVVEGNDRALHFYEREGFVRDGARRWEPDDRTHEVRMRRPSGRGTEADGA